MDRDIFFGDIVKEHRAALDLTQAELARRVACATITIRKIEADALRPSIQIAERLATSLKIPLEERAAFVRLARASTLKLPLLNRCPPHAQLLKRSVSKTFPGAPSAVSSWVTAWGKAASVSSTAPSNPWSSAK
jgi:DNA-binding XRE family transcriptional regulator